MKAFTVHEVFEIARFTDAPCISVTEGIRTLGLYAVLTVGLKVTLSVLHM
jgi:hypothetical protein